MSVVIAFALGALVTICAMRIARDMDHIKEWYGTENQKMERVYPSTWWVFKVAINSWWHNG